jgi:signal transduction histidine kinase
VLIDIGVAVAMLALAAESGQDDWAFRAALAAAALAGAALRPVPACLAVSVLAAAFTTETLIRKHLQLSPLGTASDLSLLLTFAVVTGCGAYSLRRRTRRADRSPPVSDLAKALHDTALATLSAIAGGQVDPGTEQVRRRAAQDVLHIRRLLLDESGAGGPLLDARLREVVEAAELLGLRVHWQGTSPAQDLPPAAVAALADATREALNNVAAHAGTAECWLTLMTGRGRVTIRVVDRGRGFEPGSRPPGFGLRRSLLERMTTCGGAVRLSSAPGVGTCVDLIWPK